MHSILNTGITSILQFSLPCTRGRLLKGKIIKRARKQPPRFKDNAFEHASVNDESVSRSASISSIY